MNARLDVDEHVLPPQTIDDVAVREELGSTLHQQDQQVHRLPFQPDRVPVAAQLVGGEVELEVVEAKAQIIPAGAPPLNLRLVVGDRGRQVWTVVIGNATGSAGTRVR